MSTILERGERRADVVAPARSLQQRRDALKRANYVRSSRARLKPDVKAGRRDGVALILDPPDWLASMRVYDLLLQLPKIGPVKATKTLTATRISPAKTIGGLSERQRRELAGALGYHRGLASFPRTADGASSYAPPERVRDVLIVGGRPQGLRWARPEARS